MQVTKLIRYVKTISKDTGIRDAEESLISQNVKMLPVVNRNKLIGLVTMSDLARALPSHAISLSKWGINYLIDEIKIEKIMVDPVSIPPDMELTELVELAMEKGFYNFPVVESGSFRGMIYDETIFRFLADEVRRPAIKIEVNIREEKQKGLSFLKWLRHGGAG